LAEILIGPNAVLEALKAGRRDMDRIYLSRRIRSSKLQEILALAKARGVSIRWEPKARLTARAGTVAHQGVIAIVSEVGYLAAQELLEQIEKKRRMPFLLVLDGVEDPQNLGSIIRTAEAAGVDGLIIPKDRAVGLTSTVAKVSCGALEYVPIAKVTNLPFFLKRLKGAGFWVIGADPKAERSLYEVNLQGALALVVGGENRGLRPLVKEQCDFLVSIPMRGRISSLNTAIAAAILIFERVRQVG